MYSSEDDAQGDNFISNSSFEKMHRFIIPITDITKAITFDFIVEDYSVTIKVKQDKYEADFKCSDLMYQS